MQEFTTPLAIISAKDGDILDFSTDQISPYTPELTVYDMAGTITHGPAAHDTERAGAYYWHLVAGSAGGMATKKQYYRVTITDTITGFVAKTWIVYVNDNLNYDTMLDRAVGLAGHNIRKYSHVWTKGLLTSFQMKIYASSGALETADAGGTDDFIAHYEVICRYDNSYNRYEITSTRIA